MQLFWKLEKVSIEFPCYTNWTRWNKILLAIIKGCNSKTRFWNILAHTHQNYKIYMSTPHFPLYNHVGWSHEFPKQNNVTNILKIKFHFGRFCCYTLLSGKRGVLRISEEKIYPTIRFWKFLILRLTIPDSRMAQMPLQI